MRKLALRLLTLLLISFTACVQEDFPKSASSLGKAEPEPIIPTCIYENEVFTELNPALSGKPRSVSIEEQWGEETVVIEFSGSLTVYEIHYNDPRGFENIKSMVMDYSKQQAHPVEITLKQFRSAGDEAISGKLFIQKQDNGDVKITWCDVTFDNGFGGLKGEGGITLSF